MPNKSRVLVLQRKVSSRPDSRGDSEEILIRFFLDMAGQSNKKVSMCWLDISIAGMSEIEFLGYDQTHALSQALLFAESFLKNMAMGSRLSFESGLTVEGNDGFVFFGDSIKGIYQNHGLAIVARDQQP